MSEVYETIKRGLEDAVNGRVTEHMVEYVPVVRCKDCKYKPKWREGTSEKSRDGFDLIFPDWRNNPCPCQCEDEYYAHMPDDNWYCANGKR